MIDFIDLLQSFGDQMLEYVWFPLLIWTIIAVPVAAILHRAESISPVYQYHSRMALLVALPMGIAGSYLTNMIYSGIQSAERITFLVLQNPIAVSGASSEASAGTNLSNPTLWLGILGVLLSVGTLFFVVQMLANYVRLKSLEQHLTFRPLSQHPKLVSNLPTIDKLSERALVAYCPDARVPFTYGWKKTKIVIPEDLINDPDALSMAVQHELMHIKHRDFLINGVVMFIKAIFWFHPLVHYLHKSGQEYREITCDGEVLASKQFSRKKYASLLYKLAKREHQTNLAMSMAVNPSSLKKRIQIMSSQDNISTKFRSSFMLTLTFAACIILTISCTDMADDGITNSEIEQTQSQMATISSDSNPLYVVNGEEWDNDEESTSKLSRLKSKYIESIDVLKGDKARSEYGEKGKNGVIKMSVLNPEKAFSDLKNEALMPPSSPSKSDEGDFYVAVENMPELEGGLAGLQQKIQYPKEAQEAGTEGRVIVQFIVNEQGEVEDPQIIKGIGDGLDQEALRVVRQAQFTPGQQDGKPVRIQYSLPITFQLSSEKSEG